jgi:cullin 1
LGIVDVDFSVQVLTAGYWPTFTKVELTLPTVMHKCVQVFTEYYERQTNHRKLQWQHSLGNASVKGIFKGKSFDLQVTTLQAVVLLAFNDETVRDFSSLLGMTGFPEDVLKKALHSLSCGKYRVLKKLSASGTDGGPKADKAVLTSDVFHYNDSFTCPMRKIRIPMASLEDNQNSNKRIEEDRSYVIEASIVRIMKARKTLQHQQLVAEVLTQLTFFKPDVKVPTFYLSFFLTFLIWNLCTN